jgi:hypothetical protein
VTLVDDKRAYELRVFLEFVRITELVVDEGSIKQGVPPNPDISCTIDGIGQHFELTRLTDEQIETKVIHGRSGYSNFRIEIEDVLRIIKSKCKKRYEADGSVGLVVQEGATPIDGLWARGQASQLRELVEEAIAGSQFTRAWLVDISASKFLVAENPKITLRGARVADRAPRNLDE